MAEKAWRVVADYLQRFDLLILYPRLQDFHAVNFLINIIVQGMSEFEGVLFCHCNLET